MISIAARKETARRFSTAAFPRGPRRRRQVLLQPLPNKQLPQGTQSTQSGSVNRPRTKVHGCLGCSMGSHYPQTNISIEMSLVNMAVSQLLTPYNLQRRWAHKLFHVQCGQRRPNHTSPNVPHRNQECSRWAQNAKGQPSHNPQLASLYVASPRVLSAIDLMQLLKLKRDCVLMCVAG